MTLAAAAEDLVALLPSHADSVRLDLPWGALRHAGRPGRDFCNVARVRLEPDDVPAAVEQAREWFAALGQREHAWWLGASSTPADLDERLAAAGLVPDPAMPTCTTMVLAAAPRTVAAPGVEVRALTGPDDLAAVLTIDAAVWDLTDEDRATLFDDIERRWQRDADDPRRTTFLALLDGEPSAYGSLALLPDGSAALLGGSTLPQARGRGLYSALVAARWEAAVAQGASGLVVQASDMSRPVLEKLGFETTGVVRLWAWLDRG